MATHASPERFSTTETLARSSSYTSQNYQSFVTKTPGLTNAPSDAASHPHHITSSNGTITKFKNPYPSWGGGPKAFSDIFW